MTADIAAEPPPPTMDICRVLIVDDNDAIHDDFRKILRSPEQGDDPLDEMAQALFGQRPAEKPERLFALDSAYQGQEALARVRKALADSHPYRVAFVDVRMPPGWDGLETVEALWSVDDSLQVVLCTAYADYSWEEITTRVGASDGLLILKKPFHSSEVRQLAQALSTKWRLARARARRFADLEAEVAARVRDLADTNLKLRREIDERAQTERALRRTHRMEALGRLAAGLGHEINNPLTFLIGSLESIQGELESHAYKLPLAARSAVEELLDTSLVGAERIAQLVRDIKSVARPTDDAAHDNDHDHAVDGVALSELITGAVETATAETKRRYPLELVLDVHSTATVKRRVGDLEQALTILVENISRAAIERWQTPALHVSARHDRERNLLIDITALGAAPPSSSHPSPQRGTHQHRSLGLAIARALVMRLDGVIETDEDSDRRLSFALRLPATHLA
ncbi:MAG: hypothetical protein Tsb0020_47010 [Haliangiales bacterium]